MFIPPRWTSFKIKNFSTQLRMKNVTLDTFNRHGAIDERNFPSGTSRQGLTSA